MRRELAAAHAALAPLDEIAPLDPALAARIRAAVHDDAAPSPRPVRAWLPAAAVVCATALLFGRHLAHARSIAFPLLLWAIAIVASVLAMTEHAVVVAVATVGLSVLLSVFGDVPTGALTLAGSAGCLSVELLVGVVAGVACVLGSAGRRTASLVATCGAGALAAQVGVTISCHGTGGMAHTLLAHTLGVVLTMIVAVAVSWRRSKPRDALAA